MTPRDFSRRELFRRTGILVAGAAALELVGRHPFSSVARAATGITLDPTIDPLLQGYLTDGTGDYHTGARLIINDTSTATHRTFFKAVPEIATSAVAVDVKVGLIPTSVILVGVDTGVRAILSEGAGGFEAAAALIERPGSDRRVAFALGANNFSQGVAFDWGTEQVFRIERNPDPSQRAVLTVAGQPPEVLTDADLPPARRFDPNFEFGCLSDPATAAALFGPIGLPPVFPLAIVPSRCDLNPNATEKVHVAGTFTLDAASDGIDPVAEGAALRLGTAGGSLVYPVGTDFMPVAFEVVLDGWRITDAEKQRTGIEQFKISRTADPRQFEYRLIDRRTGLPQSDYSRTVIELVIGSDEGTTEMALIERRRGAWHLA